MLGECIVVEYDSHGETHMGTKMVRGRKEHKCCECHRIIPRGVRHENSSFVGSGWYHFRTCGLCVSVRSSLFKITYAHGELWETVRYHFEHRTDIGEDDSWLDPPTHPIRGGA